MDDYEIVMENNIIKMPDLNYAPNPYGIGYEIFDCMKRNKNLVAQIDSQTQEKNTYTELLRKCIRTAIEMKARNITPDDIVCVCSYNQLNNCVPFIAALFVGAKVCTLDPSLAFNDSKYLLSQVKPKIVFVVSECKTMYEEILNELSSYTEVIIFGDDGENSLEYFLRESPEEDIFEPEKVKNIYDTVVILFSSGTTGLAKGICLSHFTLLSQAKNFLLCGFDTAVCLSVASLYWISAVIILTQSILGGTTRIVCRSFSPLEAWQNITKFKATMMFVAPSQAIAMLKAGRPDAIDTTSLLDLFIGGGSISSKNLLAVRDLLPGTNVFAAYGLTEVSGVGTIFRTGFRKDLFLLHDKPGSCGRPITGISYKIVDLKTEETVGCNEIGEIRMKTKLQLNGYYNLDSSNIWDSDGWLKTGDVGYYDEDFCFYIVDRIKEMLKFQSWHVAPALLEGILQEHWAVKVAVVIGVPHEEDGEHPLGLVVLSENAQHVTPEMLVQYVNERVDDRQKLRAGVMFISDIPYTPTGKIKRKLLKENVLAELKNK